MLQKSNAQVRVYRDPDELALKAARLFARLADQYVIGCGRFTVALSGGSTPKAMFSVLAAEPFLDTVPCRRLFLLGRRALRPPVTPTAIIE
jgi:6-phosphogluconolactonase